MNKEPFEKIITFRPAYDKRHSDPTKNYGIGSVSLNMVLKGNHGAISFTVLTGWNLPHVQEEYKGNSLVSKALAADLSYHSPIQQYGGQLASDCEYVNTDKCYCDGSTLEAERVFKIMLEKGSDGVWEAMEAWYQEVFNTVSA